MLLYKYRIIDGYLLALLNGNVFFRSMSTLNDPYEGAFKSSHEKIIKHFARKMAEKMMLKYEAALHVARYSESNGEIDLLAYFRDFQEIIRRELCVLSLSQTFSSSLMWSHYADEHRGVCVGVEVDPADDWHKPMELANSQQERLMKVNYEVSIREVIEDDGNFNYEMLADAVSSKSKEWDYENEWRMFILSKSCGIGESRQLPSGRIKELIFGSRADINAYNDIVNIAKKLGISVYKANLSADKYMVNRDAS